MIIGKTHLFLFNNKEVNQRMMDKILYLKDKLVSLIDEWNLFSLKTVFVIFIALIIVVGHTGLSIMPNIGDQFKVSQNLTSVPFSNPEAQYVFTNYFQPLVFRSFGGSNSSSYILYAEFIFNCRTLCS